MHRKFTEEKTKTPKISQPQQLVKEMQVDLHYRFRKSRCLIVEEDELILTVEEEREKLELSCVSGTNTLMSNLAISSKAEKAY